MCAASHTPSLSHAEPAWLTLRQAAARTQTSTATLRREIRCGRLRHARVGGRTTIRLRPAWLDAWLEATTTPTEAKPLGAAARRREQAEDRS